MVEAELNYSKLMHRYQSKSNTHDVDETLLLYFICLVFYTLPSLFKFFSYFRGVVSPQYVMHLWLFLRIRTYLQKSKTPK